MTTAGAANGASPMPPSPGMPPTDSLEFLDYEDQTGDLPDYSALPSLQDVKYMEPQATLLATGTVAAGSPDSLLSSFRDSSSESASSKRTGSSASGKSALTAGDVMMTDGPEIKSDWPTTTAFGRPEDPNFLFDTSNDVMLHDGCANDADESKFFDFDTASSNQPRGAVSMDSPEMPALYANGPFHTSAPSNVGSANHDKRNSVGYFHRDSEASVTNSAQQYSLSQPMTTLNMTGGSRECSPMSHGMIMSHEASPSALMTNTNSTPSPGDFTSAAAMSAMTQPGYWQPKLDPAAQQMMHNMPMQFHSPDGLPMSIPQQMAMFPPEFVNRGGCRLTIHPTPTKSRVETQIPIKLTLYPLPPGIKRLHLPTHTISKPKLLAKPAFERAPDALELYTMLVCTSAMGSEENKTKAFQRAAAATHTPMIARSASDENDEESKPQNGAEVRICAGCITRERKRAARKKIKKVEEEEMWNRDESRRVIVFNTQEVKEWQKPSGVVSDSTVTGRPELVAPPGAMQVDAPMRIACYCRHHAEKVGFQVIFTIKDWQGRLVAQEMSQSIMITDDHKTHPIPQPLNPTTTQSPENNLVPMMSTPLDAGPLNTGGAPFRISHSSSDLQSLQRNAPAAPPFPVAPPTSKTTPPAAPTVPRNLSRPPSPGAHSGPIAKKRKASGSRVPIGMAMTRLETTPPCTQMPANVVPAPASASTSPFSPSLNNFQSPPDAMFGSNGAATIPQPFATGPPTPNSNDQTTFTNANRSASMDNLAMPLFSAPASAHPSRAPSPSRLANGVNGVNAISQSQFNAMTYMPANVAPARTPPTIHKIIPNEGPKSGGIEVTILGASFYQGLEVLFGDQKATTTTFWGESSLVCLLPPSPVAGPVMVTFKQSQAAAGQAYPLSKMNQMFKYVDDDEEKLIRTALSILGHKMSGQMVDVKELAQRIIGSGDAWGAAGPSANPGGFGGNTFNMSTESQLLKCLELIDLDDNPRMSRLDLRRSTGQTMLHMGCALGYHRFVAGLIARGANCDLRDKGGFTPMHLAAMNDHESIVRRLIQAGADPTIRTLSGLQPADVARSTKMIEHIRLCEGHIRSRSRGSLHSRASSAASLRSLWDRPGVSSESESPDDGEESPEYSSGDYEDEEEEEEDSWLDMRRRSSGHAFAPLPDMQRLQRGPEDVPPGLPSPTAALASVVGDHFAAQFTAQIQQLMTVNFPILPQMPTLPRMPMLPDYQAYLQQTPLMGRVTSLMPGMSGSRPGSVDDENSRQIDGRWWDLSSFRNNNNNSAPPPAYDEIFPQEELDRKQAAALDAAAEAVADSRLAGSQKTEATETVEDAAASSSTAPVPSVLKIGRKSAITKEQQQNFLRARQAKLKGMRSDKNLWFIWIPLLTCILAAMLYSRFPQYFSMAYATLRYATKVDRVPEIVRNVQNRVVEVV